MQKSSKFGTVVAVCRKAEPGLPKLSVSAIRLIENYGVENDYHAGKFVRHRYLAKKNPTQPNVRQALITDTTILGDLAEQSIALQPGMLGENITIEGLSVMELTPGMQVEIGEALLEVTEIRNPCLQLNEIHPRLLKSVVSKIDGKVRKNAGMMTRILKGGQVQPGDSVIVHQKPSGS